MTKNIITPKKADSRSISQRKLIFGVGINDAEYYVTRKVDGKRIWMCEFYRTWTNMLTRVYSKEFLIRNPTYLGVSVCDEWLWFSNFRDWMILQDHKNKSLDKDILKVGNKIYSPETCCFVEQSINTLIINKGNQNTGVSYDEKNNKYVAQYSNNGKQIKIGRYKNKKEALKNYNKIKCRHILDIAKKINNKEISKGLKRHAELLNE